MDKLRKKEKEQYEDNITDVCKRDFHIGKKIVTENLVLAVQIWCEEL